MHRKILIGLICVFASISGCGNPPKPSGDSAKPAAPAVPPEILAAGQAALGGEAEVLAWGDLALTGKQQLLVVNRLIKPGMSAVPGTVLTRLAILEDVGGKWKEVLLCDEHLKNTNGFLGGTPTAGISAWRLQFEKDPDKGLLLFFMPYNQGPEVRAQTIEVRWNPEPKRYQAMDANHETFIGETPALEEIHRPLK